MHNAPMPTGMRVAMMHNATIIPQYHVTDCPRSVRPLETILCRMAPQKVEQILAFGTRPADNKLRRENSATTEIKCFAPGHRMQPDQRMVWARHVLKGLGLPDTLPQNTGGIAASILFGIKTRNARLHIVGQSLVR